MDEWGTSVWDTPSHSIPQQPLGTSSPPSFPDISEPAPELSHIESFDDHEFSETSQPPEDDDFGDDFGDFDGGHSMSFEDGGFREGEAMHEFTPPPPVATWEPLRLDPLPPPSELSQQVHELLSQVWTPANPEELLTNEGIREVEGLGQVLITPERWADHSPDTYNTHTCDLAEHYTKHYLTHPQRP